MSGIFEFLLGVLLPAICMVKLERDAELIFRSCIKTHGHARWLPTGLACANETQGKYMHPEQGEGKIASIGVLKNSPPTLKIS
jgi:hypothetical protein